MSETLYLCVVCRESEANAELLTNCFGCGELYHLNPYQGEGKDCGDAWIGGLELPTLQFYCRLCIEREQRERPAQEAAAAATVSIDELLPGFRGAATAMPSEQELLAQLMRGLAPAAGAAAGAGEPPPLRSRPGARRRFRRIG